MAFMAWDESLSVDIEEIDRQHRQLIGMIDEFYSHVGKDTGQAFRALVDALVEYARYHFATEEEYFRRFGYPETASHLEMHRKFTEKVLDVQNRLKQGRFVVSLEITTFLKDWLAHHIKESDQAYSRNFHERGLL